MDIASMMAAQKDAAAAVSALFFAACLMAIFNVKYTGFKLYIPVGIAALGESTVRRNSQTLRDTSVILHAFQCFVPRLIPHSVE